MLEPDLADDLRTIAEVSVTMAGFAAVAGAIRLRSEAELEIRNRGWYSALLATGIQAALLALFPLLFVRIPALSEYFWRWCHAVALIVNGASWVFWIRYSFWGRPLRVVLGTFTVVDWIIVPLGVIVFFAVFAVVLGWLQPYAPVIYLSLLIQLLLVASVHFVRQFGELGLHLTRTGPNGDGDSA